MFFFFLAFYTFRSGKKKKKKNLHIARRQYSRHLFRLFPYTHSSSTCNNRIIIHVFMYSINACVYLPRCLQWTLIYVLLLSSFFIFFLCVCVRGFPIIEENVLYTHTPFWPYFAVCIY